MFSPSHSLPLPDSLADLPQIKRDFVRTDILLVAPVGQVQPKAGLSQFKLQILAQKTSAGGEKKDVR